MIRKAWIIAAIGLTILGCNFLGPPSPPTPPNPDTLPDWNYFDAPDCISGCWNDLRPGQTTEEELIEHYQEQGIQEEGIEFGVFTVYRAFLEEGMVIGDIFVKDGILFSLDLNGGNLELSTILDNLGEPPIIYLRYDLASVSQPLSGIRLIIYYPSDGFIFDYDLRSGLHGEQISEREVSVCIEESIVPVRVEIYESGTIEEVLVQQDSLHDPDDKVDTDEEMLATFIDSLTRWLGVGCHTISE